MIVLWSAVLVLPCLSFGQKAAVELPLLPRTPPPTFRRSLRSTQDNTVALTNVLGTQYLVPIRLNDDTFHVQVDTGSADLWVGCEFADDASHCEPPVGPCDQVAETELVYGSGRVCLDSRRGSFQMGSLDIPQINYSVGKSTLLSDGSQGILGLAPRTISPFAHRGNDSFPVHHLESFSMTLSSGVNSPGSKLVLNGVDQTLVASDDLVGFTMPLVSATHWTVSLNEMQTNGAGFSSMCGQNACHAIADSGSTFLSMPQAVFAQFAAIHLQPHGCIMAPSDGYYTCPRAAMAHLPTLTFILDHRRYDLQPWDYSWQVSPTTFLVQLQTSPSGDRFARTWVLGATFLKVYPTTYHVQSRAVTFYCRHGRCDGGKAVAWEDIQREAMTLAWILSWWLRSFGLVAGVGLVLWMLSWCHELEESAPTRGKHLPIECI